MEPQVVKKTSADEVVKRDTVTAQVIAQGPTASQEATKMLGTNGGGFFNSAVYGTAKSRALPKTDVLLEAEACAITPGS
jgi:hypothetical protein